MKTVEMFEKGEEVYIKMQITKVTLRGGVPEYELKDPKTGEFLDNMYTSERMIPIPAVHEEKMEELEIAEFGRKDILLCAKPGEICERVPSI